MKQLTMRTMILGAALSALLGCGGAGTNNDQGVSFNLFGFFAIDQEGKIDCKTRTSGSVAAISTSTEVGQMSDVISAFGVENFLSGQAITVQRAMLQFVIAGAATQPPDTSVPAGLTLAPQDNNAGTSLPPSFVGAGGGTESGVAAIECRAFAVVPSNIMEWINLNRANLPEPPFIMEVFVTMHGVTTSGHPIDSNTLSYPVYVQNDNLITPTTNPGTGTGGSTTTDTGSGTQLSDQPLS